MSADLRAPARSMASWTIGAFGIAGLVAIIAGVYTSHEALLTVAVVVALAVCAFRRRRPWQQSLHCLESGRRSRPHLFRPPVSWTGLLPFWPWA
jgi:hypothetical protein